MNTLVSQQLVRGLIAITAETVAQMSTPIANAKRSSDESYVKLNNMYLAIERGDVELTIGRLNWLFIWLEDVYPMNPNNPITPKSDFGKLMQEHLREHWVAEFAKLPNYENV